MDSFEVDRAGPAKKGAPINNYSRQNRANNLREKKNGIKIVAIGIFMQKK